ncbi:MAG: hypothetical protein ACO1N0_13120 [Fluviicola sp.]
MRFLLFLLIILHGNPLFAQKRKKNQEPFAYSYTITHERYKFEQVVHIRISKGVNDTLIISGKSDSLNLKGKVYISQYGINTHERTDFEGAFEFKLDAKTITKGLVFLYLEDLENYRDEHVVIDFNKTADMFTVKLKGKSIFDPETGYVYIHSKTELSQAEIDQIIRCLGSKRDHSDCYDHSKIWISIAI